jgi:hypothetical protein
MKKFDDLAGHLDVHKLREAVAGHLATDRADHCRKVHLDCWQAAIECALDYNTIAPLIIMTALSFQRSNSRRGTAKPGGMLHGSVTTRLYNPEFHPDGRLGRIGRRLAWHEKNRSGRRRAGVPHD